MRALNLALAELSLILAVKVAESSPLAILFPTKLLYVLLILPLALTFMRRNPYDLPVLIVALALVTVKLLTNSEAFYSLLDALYYLGYRDLSENLNSLFLAYKGSCLPQLTAIVVMFTVAQISWRLRRLEKLGIDLRHPLSILIVFGVAVVLFFPSVAEFRIGGMPLLFLGLSGLCLILLAVLLLA